MSAEELAREIANELFTNGIGEIADRLVCEVNGRDRGGWCRQAVEKIIADRIKSLVEDAERWRFVNAFHVRAGDLHMDGTSSFVLGGSLGRAMSIEEALAERMKMREWHEKRGTP